MSRLSDSRNPPGLKCPSRMRRVIFRKKQPSYNAPIALHGVCRSALNEAIRGKDFGAADRIVARKYRKLYGSLPKVKLVKLLDDLLHNRLFAL